MPAAGNLSWLEAGPLSESYLSLILKLGVMMPSLGDSSGKRLHVLGSFWGRQGWDRNWTQMSPAPLAGADLLGCAVPGLTLFSSELQKPTLLFPSLRCGSHFSYLEGDGDCGLGK